jgi:hypothetical protein
MTDEIDAVSAALHGDKRTVLQHQLREIAREILEYILLELAQRHEIHEEIRQLRDERLKLAPSDHEPDDPTKRKDRLRIEQEILGESREQRALQLKIRDTTKDLRREEREKQGELLHIDLREQRLRDFDAP